ncbi:SMP-30/gluconolactonase/LRE family protein [Litoribrevibacter albus]|uniref:Strictosidine synthase conserved region domain-containing protein n=1 Tax=Litoribrevibacter albus TaxID=1473156 RepID=A0AA37W6Q1_9GAMM|nr:SMP-30/gluconolactonase/LRE family protein [Litoribrevibacter albus]GLQ31810.1 hypothetical protein GCM10007876_22890 [Litoribrevibacter albus]
MRFGLTLLAFIGLGAVYLSFWPIPIDAKAWQVPQDMGYVGDFEKNNRLSSLEIISLNGEEGPEDFAVNAQGQVFFSLLGGKIMRIGEDGSFSEFVNTGGRPLGLEFAPSGELIVADAFKGLLSVSPSGDISLLTDSVLGSKIRYADDVDVTSTGEIYFSDASTKFPAESYGTYQASLLDIMEHGGNGRVIHYSPITKESRIIVSGLQFANGISVTHDESAILINETGTYSVLKHWIKGEKAGQTETLISNLPGFPDNINKGSNQNYWLGLVSPRSKALDLLAPFPFLREAVQRLPKVLRPKAQHYGHVVSINDRGEILLSLQDPEDTYSYTTGAAESGPWLYLSSLHERRIARVKYPLK